MFSMLKFIPVLICSLLLGHWFFSEVRKAKLAGLRWFAPYFTVPGILVIIALITPLFIYFFGL